MPTEATKARRLVFAATMVLVLAALVASAILLVDYVRPAPVFCDETGGCERVKATVWAHPFGVPLPAFGIAGMLAIGFASLTPGLLARRLQAALAGFAGGAAVFLLVVQARMGTVCPFCAVVDGASVLLALLSGVRLWKQLDPPGGRVTTGFVVAELLAIGAPLAIGFSRPLPPPPPPIATTDEGTPDVVLEEMKRTPPGMATVVDFVDFECPFCRRAHAALSSVLDERKGKVRVVRVQVPLSIHEHAMDAARAACCGEDKSDALADALFHAEDLTPAGCAKLAAGLGVDPARYKACVEDPKTDERIAADKARFKKARGRVLPLMWINGKKLEARAAQDRQTLIAAIDGP